jgi:hypothetical protein
MQVWFSLVALHSTIGLKSNNAAFREQRRLWNVMPSPKFLEHVAAERFYKVATKLAGLWEKKAKMTGGKLAFEAQENISMTMLDDTWKTNMGDELGLLDVNMCRLRQEKAFTKGRKGTAVFSNATMPQFYVAFRRLLVCLDWVMQGVSPRMYTWLFKKTGMLGRAGMREDEILNRCIAASTKRVFHLNLPKMLS